MSCGHGTIEAGGATPPATVEVWDPLVRVFHWSLAALVAVAFATGDEVEAVHVAAGYGVVGLMAVRIAWGFVGTRHARFSDFVASPGTVVAYLRDMLRFRAPRHLGHNPAGGAMIVALILLVAVTGATGIMMTSDAFWGAEWVEDVHEAFAHLTLVFAGLHVAGVIVSSLAHGENLVKAMITGRKRA